MQFQVFEAVPAPDQDFQYEITPSGARGVGFFLHSTSRPGERKPTSARALCGAGAAGSDEALPSARSRARGASPVPAPVTSCGNALSRDPAQGQHVSGVSLVPGQDADEAGLCRTADSIASCRALTATRGIIRSPRPLRSHVAHEAMASRPWAPDFYALGRLVEQYTCGRRQPAVLSIFLAVCRRTVADRGLVAAGRCGRRSVPRTRRPPSLARSPSIRPKRRRSTAARRWPSTRQAR